MRRKKIHISAVLASQTLGIKEVDNGIWLVAFMDNLLPKGGRPYMSPGRTMPKVVAEERYRFPRTYQEGQLSGFTGPS
jgi:hypothetical protein